MSPTPENYRAIVQKRGRRKPDPVAGRAGGRANRRAGLRQRQDTPVKIQASFNFFVSGATGDSEEAQKSREKARRIVYEMAARECDLLRDVLAKDCRMEAVSSNVSRQVQYGQQPTEGYTVNGSVSLQITLK